eukprot:CAMPEP_0197034414 /NCGR_PEP_ID=MMETSP1384-20130603/12542_1 /TAXON_ID=29189 /ORGANISM="Ammonia sp." /LENGTH=670 /DNA_ID=CAMNT_0042464345 /DNA_START=4 /DNA_END=2013 /DNA_ORIENTATION=+
MTAEISTDKRSLMGQPLINGSHGDGDIAGYHPDLSAKIDISSVAKEDEYKGSRRNENLWLGWNDIQLCIADTKTKQPKYILGGVSGQAFGGEVYGIIGASGGGKTTLLSVLGGRIGRVESLKTKCTTSGNVQLNDTLMDCSKIRNFEYLRQSVAYVLQEDILLPNEFAREAIEVSALLRLSHKRLSKEEKLQKAAQILQALDLAKCSETKIGGPAVRGLSGGERKRVSIGVELVTNPTVLMLDEPTSGLDSAIAYQTMLLLRKLANSGKMVIASIHQPSSEIFNTLDRVLILARGKAVYEGKRSYLAEYLLSIGYECPRYSNIADFVLQKISENTDYFIDKWQQYIETQDEHSEASVSSIKLKMASHSSRAFDIDADQERILQKQEIAPICLQLSVLMKRQFRIYTRDKVTTFVRFGQAIFTAVLEGLLWWRLKPMDQINFDTAPPHDESESHQMFQNTNDRFGGIFFAVTFAAMNAIMTANLTFPSQRLVFQKERLANWYYTSLWIFAKTCIDLPPTFVVVFVFSVVIRFMVNFNAAFYEIFFVLSLVALVADSMGFCLGCVAKRPEIATQLTPVTIIPLFLFSNFFVVNSTIPVWIRWIQWIDCFYYGTEALCIFEFSGVESKDHQPAGDEFLNQFKMKKDNLWRDIYALIGLFVAFRLLAISLLLKK